MTGGSYFNGYPVRGGLLALLICLLGVVTAAAPGCRPDEAARRKAAEERKKKELEKPKPDFELGRIAVLPHDDLVVGSAVKPGHWFQGQLEMRANNFDFRGELEVVAVDRQGRPLPLEQSPFTVRSTRPVTLPKAQRKAFELTFFAPQVGLDEDSNVWLQAGLLARGGGRRVQPADQIPVTRLQPYQYYLVVLAERSDRYAYLKKLDVVAPPRDDAIADPMTADVDYVVLLPKSGPRLPLPDDALAWTAIACVVWDEFDPDLLRPAQQQALRDWLYWGGQLVISGPRSLDLLQGSFLSLLLPARAGATVPHDADRLRELNAHWALSAADGSGRRPLQVRSTRPPEGVELELQPGAAFVPHTGQLVAERRVGRGRVVVTALALDDPQLVNWNGYASFFNGALLRRPRRQFAPGLTQQPHAAWADHAGAGRDARINCGLRYFSRDAAGAVGDVDGFRADARHGVAGWTDFSGPADAARQSLNRAAGISVPDARFVLRMLGVYLLVLVPANWALFRLLGRVELAWAAVPVVALAGAVLVIRFAQLDIGFASSRTELAIVELQPACARAHVTRYTGLYTSLSTRYRLTWDDNAVLALPFSAASEQRLRLQAAQTVTLQRTTQTELQDLRVVSNSTGMIHSEQMRELGAGIHWKQGARETFRLGNRTGLDLEGVAVVRRTADDRVQAAWIGQLPEGSDLAVSFTNAEATAEMFRGWDRSPSTGSHAAEGEVALRPLLEMASNPRQLRPGDARLVGWTATELPGLETRPRPAQTACRTLVLAHLAYRPLPAPRPDVNSRLDVPAAPPEENAESEPIERQPPGEPAPGLPPGPGTQPTAQGPR